MTTRKTIKEKAIELAINMLQDRVETALIVLGVDKVLEIVNDTINKYMDDDNIIDE